MMPIRILVVRLGAMGDVIHTLPAVASLQGIPGAHITWVVDPKWTPLLHGNPHVDRLIVFDRRQWPSVRAAWAALRGAKFDLAVDFQGLLKSALVARAAAPGRLFGYAQPRESWAAKLYTDRVAVQARHIVDQHLELAAQAGAPRLVHDFSLPSGRPEGVLPEGRFVLACPLAGWRSKQWPLEYYSQLAARGVPLVVNGPAAAKAELETIQGAHIHLSGIEGLIDATRRASAVIGVDSGPLHLAAALGKAGVAIFGPTDPARNGPYGDSMRVLRAAGAVTTYKRGDAISPGMMAVKPEHVLEVLP